jgi:hypothetical protein
MPRTLAEWATYIASLPAEGLARKARAINSIDVVDRLLEDGLTAAEVETVYVLFAQRMKQLSVVMPDGGLYDWRDMALRTTPVNVTPAAATANSGADVNDDELADFLRE